MAKQDQALQQLIAAYREDGTGEHRGKWIAACRRYLASSERPAILDELGDDVCVALHGSTTRNIDDPYSDIDCYLLLDPAGLARLDAALGSRFIDIEIDGKEGHLNAELHEGIEAAFADPDLETIYELRNAVAVLDPKDRFTVISRRAQEPMTDEVRRAAPLRCYVEMRSYHRSADNPMDRHDQWSTLSSIVDTVNYALRCALVLDRRSYPYVKWLYIAATASPTGRAVLKHVDDILHLVQSDKSALIGPEKENEISSTLRLIRQVLVDQARATGIDEPWLTRWWHYLDASDAAFDGVEWAR